ncbi:Transmembrane sensor domain-containing protein [Hyella patelloides LEGE 07179]|uniref:histidine kinase n=1 Tax=Hyella patelloides LEGE 07179 TaxID=945734 RepID=A0A563VTX1_9CYAN|nr:CHASE2 domain-containing protein [Hyella patelloides]VEP14926.1 Transmembrane sensor domain-containing protein [Hyella patelloides LEGE 07179]
MWNQLKKLVWDWRGVIWTVPCVTIAIAFLRISGWLQPLEWNALDLMFQIRPQESEDRRITIISIQETDLQKLGQWPISDRTLAQLLEKVQAQKPRAIGLSLYRNLPVEPGYEELIKVFKDTPTPIGIKKAIDDPFSAKINPPPILAELEQISASDLIIDGDGVLRRAFLFPIVSKEEILPSLGMAVALQYLEQEGILPAVSENEGWLQLQDAVFAPFEQNDGGYVRADDSGYQTLLNFRGSADNFPTITLTDVLAGRFDPELFRDRIILIGSQATSIKDHFYTPYSQGTITNPIQTYSVEIQANLASQILSTVLDERPLIKIWSDSQEYFWISGWSAMVAIWGWKYRHTKNALRLVAIIIVGGVISSIILASISYIAFLDGWWLPLAPSLLSSFGSTILIIVCINVSKLQEYNAALENEVKARTRKLEAALAELQSAQAKIIFQEKLAALGTLVAGVSHELKNPLHFIGNFADLSVDLTEELREKVIRYLPSDEYKITNETYQCLDTLVENLTEIQEYSQRANDILQMMLPHPHQQSFHYQLSNIHQLIDSAINLVFYSQKNRDNNFFVTVVKEYNTAIDLIEIIPQNVSRALINIIDNAYYTLQEKYLKDGQEFTPTLKIKTNNLQKEIAIIIQDNGQGIPLQIINKIFDPFFTTKPPQEGMGLGLSISHNLITEVSQGKIKLETKADTFTRFTILLPKKAT